MARSVFFAAMWPTRKPRASRSRSPIMQSRLTRLSAYSGEISLGDSCRLGYLCSPGGDVGSAGLGWLVRVDGSGFRAQVEPGGHAGGAALVLADQVHDRVDERQMREGLGEVPEVAPG